MFGPSDWQLAGCVEVNDLRDGAKGRAVLAQDVLPVFGLRKLYVHETLAAPGTGRDRDGRKREEREGGS